MWPKTIDTDKCIVGVAQLASTPVKPYTDEYVMLEVERINNKLLLKVLEFMIYLHERYLSEFYPETSVSTSFESIFARNSDDKNYFNYVIILNGVDKAENQLIDKIGEASLIFVNEVIESSSDYWSSFEAISLSQSEIDFVISKSEQFINNNGHQKIKDPFVFSVPGPESENEVIIQGRLKKAVAEEKRGREYSGIAYSFGARGDQNVAYLKVQLGNNHQPRVLPFLVDNEMLARRAAAAYAHPEYELKITAHETIDSKGQAHWHLDSAELYDSVKEFELEMTE